MTGQKCRDLVLKCVRRSDLVISVLKSVVYTLFSATQVKISAGMHVHIQTRSLELMSSYGCSSALSVWSFLFPVVVKMLLHKCISVWIRPSADAKVWKGNVQVTKRMLIYTFPI